MIATAAPSARVFFMGPAGRPQGTAGRAWMFAYAVCGIFASRKALGELAIRRPSRSIVSYAREFSEKGAYITGWFFLSWTGRSPMADITAVASTSTTGRFQSVVPQWPALVALPSWSSSSTCSTSGCSARRSSVRAQGRAAIVSFIVAIVLG